MRFRRKERLGPRGPLGLKLAAIAGLLKAQGGPATRYVARQGTALGRDGRVQVDYDDAGRIWIGGHSVTIVDGTFRLG